MLCFFVLGNAVDAHDDIAEVAAHWKESYVFANETFDLWKNVGAGDEFGVFEFEYGLFEILGVVVELGSTYSKFELVHL